MDLEIDKRKRSSHRLKGYDYSNPGYYFITICSYDKQDIFGKCNNNKVRLSPIGKRTEICVLKIHDHYPNVKIDEYIIMPNHIHMIIRIFKKYTSSIGTKEASSNKDALSYGAKDVSPLHKNIIGTSGTIGSIIRGFKIGVTKWCRKNTDIYNVWQNSFYDRIIRSRGELIATRNYIAQNPKNWKEDRFYSLR